ncbi:MAG: hypothetical protein K6B28_10415 [Lachnospiraceae bacterium]|nr:hypothetical protein [Lachnospiraceae bacterium]
MGFYSVTGETEKSILKDEYRNGDKIGLVTLGNTCLFFKSGWKKYYIPYSDIKRCFRRVHVLPIKNKKTGENSLQVESVVVMDVQKELAQIQFPGKNSVDDFLKKIVEKNPDISTALPRKLQKKNEHNLGNLNL